MIQPNCSVCNSPLQKILEVKDHSVSQETFTLAKCSNCRIVQTTPALTEGELSKYYASENYVSHTAKSNNLTNRLFLLARRFTLDWKLRLIPKATNQPILDYGCGTGDFLTKCIENGITAEGLEPNDAAREIATRKSNSTIHKNLEAIKSRYSTITLWHVLEHVPQLQTTLSQLKDRLEQNGTLVLAVPNYKSWDALKYATYWAAYDVPRHQWHFSKDSMETLLEKCGLKIEKIIPMKLDSFYVSLLSEKYKHPTQPLLVSFLKAFFNGALSNIKAAKSGEYSSLIYFVRK